MPPRVLGGEVRHELQQLIPGQSPGEGERLLRSEHVVVVERLGCLQLLLCLFYFHLFILLGYIFDNERQTIDSQTSTSKSSRLLTRVLSQPGISLLS